MLKNKPRFRESDPRAIVVYVIVFGLFFLLCVVLATAPDVLGFLVQL